LFGNSKDEVQTNKDITSFTQQLSQNREVRPSSSSSFRSVSEQSCQAQKEKKEDEKLPSILEKDEGNEDFKE